jgi:hypothetical protein
LPWLIVQTTKSFTLTVLLTLVALGPLKVLLPKTTQASALQNLVLALAPVVPKLNVEKRASHPFPRLSSLPLTPPLIAQETHPPTLRLLPVIVQTPLSPLVLEVKLPKRSLAQADSSDFKPGPALVTAVVALPVASISHSLALTAKLLDKVHNISPATLFASTRTPLLPTKENLNNLPNFPPLKTVLSHTKLSLMELKSPQLALEYSDLPTGTLL